MKFTLSWLGLHLDHQAGADAIAARLTALGHEVEAVGDRGAELAPFTVAYVVEARPHPNADKLQVCIVDTGEGEVQVVCGAPNAHTGMKSVFARTGLTIPGTGVHLKPTVIRGVESAGMLCSEREMGLSDDHDAIIELPEYAPVGAPFAVVAGLDDPLFDVAITPDRGDCLGVRGLARDLAAAGVGRLRPLDTAPVPGAFPSPIAVALDFPPEAADACPMFIGRLIRGVCNGPSPRWLQERLRSVGLRPISALVDITNWLTLDLGRPAHVFDAGKLAGDPRLRLARPGERFRALDGNDYVLDETMTVIRDDRGPVSLAGVMGGEGSGCTEETTDVFLEIAIFDRRRTAATGRALGIESDARYRFERGIDPAFLRPGTEIATRLILDLCGGEAAEAVVAGAVSDERRVVRFRPARVASLGGIAIAPETCAETLDRLGFAVDAAAEAVAAPTWRHDIEVEPDVVEEVMRVHGFDRVPARSMPRAHGVARPVLTIAQRRLGAARRTLAARGLTEAVTWSFIPGPQAKRFGGGAPELALANPISSELTDMRPSLLPNLIAAAGRNLDRGLADVALFEVGQVYADATPGGQTMRAGALRQGRDGPRHWARAARPVDVFDAKADALAVINACDGPADKAQATNDAPDWYHPGRSGVLRLGPRVLAHFGEIHPDLLAEAGVEGPLVACEVLLDAIPVPKAKGKKSTARPPLRLSPFQAIGRDFAFVVDEDVAAADLLRAARGADKKLIDAVAVFDVYRGPELGPGRKSLAIGVTLQPSERTLTEAEIETVAAKIVAAVAKATGAVLRG